MADSQKTDGKKSVPGDVALVASACAMLAVYQISLALFLVFMESFLGPIGGTAIYRDFFGETTPLAIAAQVALGLAALAGSVLVYRMSYRGLVILTAAGAAIVITDAFAFFMMGYLEYLVWAASVGYLWSKRRLFN